MARKPRNHSIPPKTEDAIKDVKLFDKKNKYKYDWIFLTTEDNNIRRKFIKSVGNKVKCLLNKRKIWYNYATKKLLAYNTDSKSNLEYNKIYLLISNSFLLTKLRL